MVLARGRPLARLLEQLTAAACYRSPATLARTRRAGAAVAVDPLGGVLAGRVTPQMLAAACRRWRAQGVGAGEERCRRQVVLSALVWAADRDMLPGSAVVAVRDGGPNCQPRTHLPVPVLRGLVMAARVQVEAAVAAHSARPNGRTARTLSVARRRMT